MQIQYTLIRAKRKTISLRITPALEVVVRAPQRMPRADIDAFVLGHADWIATHSEQVRRYQQAHPPPTGQDVERLRALAKAYLPPRVALWAGRMGLTPSAVKINAAKGRFGSCSGKNSLNFSCLLMRYPPEAIDYVIVHELAHIVHKNHGPAFHALVAQYLPDHVQRRTLLKGAPLDG